ncbi:prepilin-type cleavage/methylation N-terminal domain protein [Pseudoramibacter alactolyticus ATCC 23263]|uniref:Prepilin-type cleavage/methylation N-terminal domain protein n=2 Tax=Pseudoramibacter TaxID=113286 RepID=E6MKB5_9FIRM|nr:prepilin-type cleavage/methylation N-terminal domain protein [Pseudoramibacter alactolyticus ATCC 23263]
MKTQHPDTPSADGFTLVEMLVALLVLALATATLPLLFGATFDAFTVARERNAQARALSAIVVQVQAAAESRPEGAISAPLPGKSPRATRASAPPSPRWKIIFAP